MKTNPFARGILRIRAIVLCLGVVGMAGVGLSMGSSVSTRLGQTAVVRTAVPQVPNVSLAQAMAAVSY